MDNTKEVVCKISKWQGNPCKKTECHHHFIYLLNSQNNVCESENLPKQGKCPYGKKWSEGE